jgi:tetratricopeptide (TPR) repeat protein
MAITAIIARILAVWLAAFAAGPTWAQDDGADNGPPARAAPDRAAQLDRLFADLKAAPDVAAGETIERDIIDLWLQSGDPETDRLMRLTIVAMSVDDYALALDYLDTIVETRPGYAEGWNKRATVYYLLDRYDESIADIERTLALEPRHFGALAGLGMIMLKIDDKERAITAFRAALAVNPILVDVRSTLTDLENELHKGI